MPQRDEWLTIVVCFSGLPGSVVTVNDSDNGITFKGWSFKVNLGAITSAASQFRLIKPPVGPFLLYRQCHRNLAPVLNAVKNPVPITLGRASNPVSSTMHVDEASGTPMQCADLQALKL